jgi:hypothetical protein
MNIRIPAKLMPAKATSSRTGCRVSISQDNGIRSLEKNFRIYQIQNEQ